MTNYDISVRIEKDEMIELATLSVSAESFAEIIGNMEKFLDLEIDEDDINWRKADSVNLTIKVK